MKKNILIIMIAIIVVISMYVLSGCTLTVETTENSVSASVDGETSEKVDGILDWIQTRIDKVFINEKEYTGASTSEKI